MTPSRRSRLFFSAPILGIIFSVGFLATTLGHPDIVQAQQKGAPKAAAQPPNAGVRAQGQDVQPSQPVAAQPDDDAITTDPRQHMRNLITNISAAARTVNNGFVVLTLGGLDLVERVDPVDPSKRAPAVTYIRSIDGVIARDTFYHPPNEHNEVKTDDKVRTEALRLLDIAQKRGLRIWSIDYAKDASMAQDASRQALAKSFIPFSAPEPDARFARIPAGRPINENPDAIIGLNHVKNYLMLTDTSAWDTQDELVMTLGNTNYDAIVLDVFHRGRTAFTAHTIDSLKYKKLGSRRLVLAYLNIGEAESYRYYWKQGWREGNPTFIGPPNPTNPDKYTAQYWDPAWRDIIYGNNSSYLYGILAQGFDGVILDGVEAFRVFEGEQ